MASPVETAAVGRRYLIVTPCRDEASHLAETIRTVAAQTVTPARWVIVDDGSTDATPEILAKAAAEHDFLDVVEREDRGGRKVGPGVIEAFYAGLASVDLDDYDFVCKLDADLELPPRYFERLLEEMAADPCLGTVSGKVYLRDADGRLSHERRGDEASVGPSKFYRVECFQAIGGFARMVGWDGIDGHMCRLKGWVAKSIDEPELRLVHRRQMGSSDVSVFKGRVRAGVGRWRIGSSLPYVTATTVYRMADAPYVVGGLCMLGGYLWAMVSRTPRFGDDAYRRYLRSYEWEVLFKGKAKALARRNREIREANAPVPT